MSLNAIIYQKNIHLLISLFTNNIVSCQENELINIAFPSCFSYDKVFLNPIIIIYLNIGRDSKSG